MEQAYFHFGTELTNLLFENWNTSTWKDFIVTFLFFVFLAISLEAISQVEFLLGQYYNSDPLTWKWQDNRSGQGANSSLLEPLRIPSTMSQIRKRRFKIHSLKCIAHVIRFFIGYLLMVTVMTYNAFLLIAVVGGSTAGYFAFGHLERKNSQRRQSHWQTDLHASDNHEVDPDQF